MPKNRVPASLRALGQLVALLLPGWLRRRKRLARIVDRIDPHDPHVASWSAWLITSLATGIGVWLALRPAELRAGLAGPRAPAPAPRPPHPPPPGARGKPSVLL